MAEKDKQGKDEESRSVNANSDETSSSDSDGLHPLEYIEMQENDELQNYLSPLGNDDEDEEGNPQAMEQQGSGNKGKILTSDGLEYE